MGLYRDYRACGNSQDVNPTLHSLGRLDDVAFDRNPPTNQTQNAKTVPEKEEVHLQDAC